MPEKTPTDLMMNAVQAGQQYNAKLMEFAATNTQATLAYLQKLAAVRSIRSDRAHDRPHSGANG
jgi:hypothetical protein